VSFTGLSMGKILVGTHEEESGMDDIFFCNFLMVIALLTFGLFLVEKGLDILSYQNG
jgi:hypothetical protein